MFLVLPDQSDMSQSMSTEPAEASSSSVTVPRKPSPVSAFDADSPLFVAKSVVAWGEHLIPAGGHGSCVQVLSAQRRAGLSV